jgi:hypothetical protein
MLMLKRSLVNRVKNTQVEHFDPVKDAGKTAREILPA